ncbi:hypothetical protein JCM10213_007225 [Rhodosporidiobolus nylandii]
MAEPHCAVCPKKAATRCSGCGEVYYCGRDHQKLVWHVHKWQCKSGSTAFVCPPLFEDEARALRHVVDEEFWINGQGTSMTTPVYLIHVGLYGGSWTDLIDELATEAPHNKRRTILLILLRLHVHECYTARPHLSGSATEPALNPWNMFAAFPSVFIAPGMVGKSSLKGDGEPLEVCKPLLEQVLLAFTIQHLYPKHKTWEMHRLLQLAWQRAKDEVKKVDFQAPQKTFTDGMLGTTSMMAQFLLEPAHEWLCQSSRDFFTFPPLSEDEAKVLTWRIKHERVFAGRFEDSPTSLERMVKLKAFGGTTKNLLTILQRPDCGIREPSRSILLLCLREAAFRTEAKVSGTSFHPSFWQSFAHLVFPFLLPSADDQLGPMLNGNSPVRAATSFLHRLLALEAVFSAGKDNEQHELVQTLQPIAAAELDKLWLFPSQRWEAKQALAGLGSRTEVNGG